MSIQAADIDLPGLPAVLTALRQKAIYVSQDFIRWIPDIISHELPLLKRPMVMETIRILLIAPQLTGSGFVFVCGDYDRHFSMG